MLVDTHCHLAASDFAEDHQAVLERAWVAGVGHIVLMGESPVPDVPAIAETRPGFEAISFYGVGVPAGVPKPVMAKLNAEIARIITMPDTREQLRQQGADAVGNSQAEFTAFFRAEMNKWPKVIKDAGIKAD